MIMTAIPTYVMTNYGKVFCITAAAGTLPIAAAEGGVAGD